MNKKILLLSLLVMQIPIDASENHKQTLNEWVSSLKNKYPAANVDSVSWKTHPEKNGGFCYLPKSQTILVPHSLLQNRDSFGAYKKTVQFDEFGALHELGHANNHKAWPIAYENSIKIGVGLLPLALIGCYYKYQPKYLKKNIELIKTWYAKKNHTTKKVIAIGAAATAAYLMIGAQLALNATFRRLDELWADQYACKHADKEALSKASVSFTLLGLTSKKSYWEQEGILTKWQQGLLVHPECLDRANKINDELKKRYGNTWNGEIQKIIANIK